MRSRDEWSGIMSDLYKAVEFIAPDHGVSTRSKAFPANPSALGKRINAIRSNLEGVGIVFEKDRSGHSRNVLLRRANSPVIPVIPSQTA